MKEDWEIKNIGEICEVIPGQSPKSKYYNKSGEGLPFYQGKKEFTEKYIDNPKTWTTNITKEAQKDDILMSVRAPVGPVNFATQKICIGRGLSAIRAGKKNDKKFLFYFFIKHKNEIIGNNGAVFNSINRDQIKAIKIPLPPLSEQKRIVAILDKAFSAIDKAKANAEKNLANAKELFESYLNGIFAEPGEDWEEKKLGEVCEVIPGQSPKSKFYNKDGDGLPFYQGKKEFTEKYIDSPKTWTTNITKEAKKDDILMSVRAPVGPVNFAAQKICIGRGLSAIRAGKTIDRNFLFFFFIMYKNEIIGNNGAVFNSINRDQIKAIKIPLPLLTEQKRIVNQLDKISVEAKHLESIYQQKINALEELKKSILKKAFEGAL